MDSAADALLFIVPSSCTVQFAYAAFLVEKVRVDLGVALSVSAAHPGAHGP